MKGIGLVFAGGGGKGAYQIGTWKYLHQQGMDRYVKAVSGSSVGALNAALFVGGSYEQAESIWENIRPEQILTPKTVSERIDDILASVRDGLFVGGLTGVVGQIPMLALGKGLLHRHWMNQFNFSRSGLIELIHQGVDFIQLRQSPVSCYATCLECPSGSVKRFLLNEYDDELGAKILLASSAIPVVFKEETIEGNAYIDGGTPQLGDNVPVQPLYEENLETIIAVHLDRDQLIDKSRFPGTQIIEIVPQADLGGPLSGMLDFTSDGAKRRIEQGYQDAKRILEPMIHLLELSAVNQKILADATREEQRFQQERKQLQARGSELMAELAATRAQMKDDGFDELFETLMKGGD